MTGEHKGSAKPGVVDGVLSLTALEYCSLLAVTAEPLFRHEITSTVEEAMQRLVKLGLVRRNRQAYAATDAGDRVAQATATDVGGVVTIDVRALGW